MLIASVLLAATAANGHLQDRCVDPMRWNTASLVAGADSSAAPRRTEGRTPVPALGTVESATVVPSVPCVRPMPLREEVDTTPHAGAAGEAASVQDSLVTPRSDADTTYRPRLPRAIEYSEAYHTRLKIHQIGAYAMLPLFIGEYVIGQKLLTSTNRSGGLKSAHSLIAGALGVVFVSNTITGAWNFRDARKDPNGRARREIHSVLMLASDVGMVATAISASNAKRSLVDARRHRTIAISSIALSAVGSGMMWLWRN